MPSPEQIRAAFVAEFIKSGRASTYPVEPADVADEHRVIERSAASLHRKLTIEIGRAADIRKHGMDASEIASRLLASPDVSARADVGLMAPKWISVARLLAHLESFGLDLPRDLSASIARRATIALLNHHCGTPPSAISPRRPEHVPVAQAAPDHVDRPPEPETRRAPQEPLAVVVTKVCVGDARMCFECGAEVGHAVKCNVSGELHDVTWDDFPALAMQFIERAKVEHAALSDQHACPSCGEPLVAQEAPVKKRRPGTDQVEHRQRAGRATEGTGRIVSDMQFQGGGTGALETLAAGTIVDCVAATAKELVDPAGRRFVAIRWKDKTRFVQESDVERLEEAR